MFHDDQGTWFIWRFGGNRPRYAFKVKADALAELEKLCAENPDAGFYLLWCPFRAAQKAETLFERRRIEDNFRFEVRKMRAWQKHQGIKRGPDITARTPDEIKAEVAARRQAMGWTDTSWGLWDLKFTGVLHHRGNNYEVDLLEIKKWGDVWDWVIHINQKGARYHPEDFIQAMIEVLGRPGHGARKQAIDGKALFASYWAGLESPSVGVQ